MSGALVSGIGVSFSLRPTDLPTRPLHTFRKHWGRRWPFQIMKRECQEGGGLLLSSDENEVQNLFDEAEEIMRVWRKKTRIYHYY